MGSLAEEGVRVSGREEPRPASASCGDIEQLYRSRSAAMVSLAFLLTGSRQAAQDVVHDAFVELHRRWDMIAEPEAYLRRAVVNRSNSLLRRRAVRRDARLDRPGVAVDHPDELWDALGRLTARRRAAVVLRFYADVSDEEAAELLGVRPATVRSLVHRALEDLREVVEP
jgi:RNA polymerase sigma factor (sigma-70 family)